MALELDPSDGQPSAGQLVPGADVCGGSNSNASLCMAEDGSGAVDVLHLLPDVSPASIIAVQAKHMDGSKVSLGRRLGAGAFATVYHAQVQGSRSSWVVKRLDRSSQKQQVWSSIVVLLGYVHNCASWRTLCNAVWLQVSSLHVCACLVYALQSTLLLALLLPCCKTSCLLLSFISNAPTGSVKPLELTSCSTNPESAWDRQTSADPFLWLMCGTFFAPIIWLRGGSSAAIWLYC